MHLSLGKNELTVGSVVVAAFSMVRGDVTSEEALSGKFPADVISIKDGGEVSA